MRSLIFILLFIPNFIFAQVQYDFEDADISDWEQNIAGRWAASTDNPIVGTYSLHHNFDNANASHDQISLELPDLNLSLGNVTWRFQIEHGYAPSGSNNWSVFLMCNQNASQMFPGGSISGYVLGVNFPGTTDDDLKLYKISDGAVTEVINTGLDWQTDIGITTAVGIEIIRDNTGNWSVKTDNNGGFDNLVEIGTGTDNTFTYDNYFGIYYEYSLAQDQKLWFDDFTLSYPITDDDSEVLVPDAQPVAANVSSLFTSAENAVKVFSFKIFDKGTSDGYPTNVSKIVIKNSNPGNSADWETTIDTLLVTDAGTPVAIDLIQINANSLIIYPTSNEISITDGTSKEFDISLILKNTGIVDNSTFQCYIDHLDSQFESENGSSFAISFPAKIESNVFTIQVIATELGAITQPAEVIINSAFLLEIAAQDSNNNIDADATNLVSLELESGIGNLSGSALELNLSSGQIEFNNLKYDELGDFIIKANTSALDSVLTQTIISYGNNDSKISEPTTQVSAAVIPSFANTISEAVSIFSFKIVDQGSGDELPTTVTKIALINEHPAQEMLWQEAINDVVVKNTDGDIYLSDSTKIVTDSIIIYLKNEPIIVADGTSKDISICVFVNSLQIEDNTTIQLSVKAVSHGFIADNSGSQFADDFTLSVTSEISAINVTATEMKVENLTVSLYNDTVFELGISAVDSFANIDVDYNEEVELEKLMGFGELTSSNGMTKDFVSGSALWNQLYYSENMTLKFGVNSGALKSLISDTLLFILPIFIDDFETGNATKWLDTADWLVTNIDSINGNFSLKHNNEDVSDTSTIYFPITYQLGEGTLRWRIKLKNGNFDPSSSNRFGFVLMADDSLSADSLNGYVVGVNMLGSSDLLSLWKISDGIYSEPLIESNLNWNKNTLAGIEVLREANGNWTLKYDSTANYSDFIIAGKSTENSFIEFNYGGIYCAYTASYAGKLWFDDIEIGWANTAPKINAVEVTNNHSLIIEFSETVNAGSAELISNYSIVADSTSAVSIISASLIIDHPNKVLLQVDSLVTDNYILTAQNISDISGLIAETEQFSFQNLLTISYGDLVITEILADPSPTVGLPEYEFLEVLNTTDYDIYLNDFVLHLGDKVKHFSDGKISPNENLILTSSSGFENYISYGRCLSMIGTTDLTNSGKKLEIISNNEELIYSVNYSDSWYGDAEKEDGGYSLEIINPLNICSTTTNWIASNDENGGTPGSVNSVNSDYFDNILPEILEYNVVSNQQIILTFSEPVDTISANNISNYSVDNEINNPDSIAISDDLFTVYLFFTSYFQDETSYILTISNIADECDNAMEVSEINFDYYIPKSYDVVITEILADPEPSIGLPAYDFFEIYNVSDYDISLNNWIIKVGDKEKTVTNYLLPANEYLIISSSVGSDSLSSFGNSFGIIGSTDLISTGKSIVLFDSARNIIDSVFYNKNWYHDSDKEDGGWTMEKIDPNNNCSEIDNWKASINPTGGTPGSVNSVNAINVDNISPAITQHRIKSTNSLKITFSENIKNQILTSDFYWSEKDIYPDSIIFAQESTKDILLYFGQTFISEENNSIQVSGISDYCGNIIIDTTISFIYYLPEYGNIVVNEIFADPEPQVGLPEYDFLELYNNSDFDINLEDFTILFDSVEKVFPEYTLSAHDFLILCPSAAIDFYNEYGNVLGIISTTNITNAGKNIQIKDSANSLIYQVSYNELFYHDEEKSEGGWSMELIDPNNLCGAINNWKASENISGGTPGILNSVYESNIDNTKPVIAEIDIVNQNIIYLKFNELLLESEAVNINNYSVSNSINLPDSIDIIQEYSTEIWMYFSQSFADGENYQLSIKNLVDFCENQMSDTVINFSFDLLEPDDLVINEIMADPSPSVGLPVEEYIELYNRSQKEINLGNLQVQSGSYVKDIPDYILMPETYVILCSTSADSAFLFVPNKVLVPSFPSLSNTEGEIAIIDTAGNIYTKVHYYDDWYSDSEKEDGGYSLEKIDYDNLCSQETNWTASISETGGTPGVQNSVFATNLDEQAPQISYVLFVSSNEIKISFSESLDRISAENKLNYKLDNDFGFPIAAVLDEDYGSNVVLHYVSELPAETDLVLTISNVMDICDNKIEEYIDTISYYQPKAFDIVINEIMADPEPVVELPNYEYIELYNKSDYDITLVGATITTGNYTKTIPDVIIASHDYLILTLIYGASELSVYGNVLPIPSFSSISNSGQDIYINDQNGRLLCFVSYDNSWYQDPFKDGGGWSLELIDAQNPLGGIDNWKASIDEKGGTPGKINSVAADNPDYTAPEFLRILVLSDSSIQLLFSETLDTSLLINPEWFTVDHSIQNPIIVDPVEPDYTKINLHFNQAFTSGTIYQVEISNEIKDFAGNSISGSCIKNFALPSLADSLDFIINEVLFNPKDDGVDYLELYNRSTKTIDLVNYLFVTYDIETNEVKDIKPITESGYLLFPESFVVLTFDPDIVRQQYYTSNNDAFIKMESFPTLANDAGYFSITDSMGKAIDKLLYNQDMHFQLLSDFNGVSLERVSYDVSSMQSSNWQSAAQTVGYGTPTYENSQHSEQSGTNLNFELEKDVFSPDNDGFDDVLFINYNLNNTGYSANVHIFNSKGREVRSLLNNELLSYSGNMVWNGLDNNSNKVPIGIYIIYIELVHPDGKVEKEKLVCVVAAKF